jgi:AGZA family xanthine/uracil permease-like MFS transporter
MGTALRDKLNAHFRLAENKTTIRTELLAGVTTFLTMGYVIFANPVILEAAGMDAGATFFATCVAAAIGTAIMGLYANYPVALAPGMGLNAFFAYTVVQGMGYSWQTALGVVFFAGALFVLLSLLPVREWIINAIPTTMKLAISAGIGLGLIVFAAAKLLSGGLRACPPAILLIAALFVLKFVFFVESASAMAPLTPYPAVDCAVSRSGQTEL